MRGDVKSEGRLRPNPIAPRNARGGKHASVPPSAAAPIDDSMLREYLVDALPRGNLCEGGESST